MEELYKIYLQHPDICTDTRAIKPGSLFFCLKGERFDGNQFAEDALAQGAAFVVTGNPDLRNRDKFFVVEDTLSTLQELANLHRQHLSIPILGVTGTNGKTTTKELTAAVLSRKYRTAFTQGNLNNHIGVPLTLLSIRPDDEIAIVEMGANHPGEIEFLCRIAQPSCGIITNIGKAHIEGFGSVEEIIHTKTALYRAVIQNGGTLFVNAQDPILRQELHTDRVIWYAENGDKSITGMSPYLQVNIAGHQFNTHLTGSYNIYNMLAAYAIGRFFGVPDEQIAEALAQYTPSNHRSQVNTIGSNVIISDYYNANPTSMEAAIRNLARLEHPHKLAILGDMLELGCVSAEEHLHIIELCDQLNIEAWFVGSEFSAHHPKHHFDDVESLDNWLREHPIENAMVLVKGSNGIHLNKLSSLLS